MRNKYPPKKEQKSTALNVKDACELMPFLLAKMGGMSRTSVKSLLSHGQVFVNEKVTTQFNHPLKVGDTVTIHKNRVKKTTQPNGLRILFEDDAIVVIDKNAGLLTVTTGSGIDTTAFSILKQHVQEESPHNKIFTVHRLDRQTSGILVFAKTPEVQHAFRDNWKEMVTKRIYAALVEGKVNTPSGRIVSYLSENPRTHIIYSHPTNEEGGKEAITHYRTVQTTDDFSLLEVELETGRKNQIRVHMKDLGHPIIGDRMYGSDLSIQRIALHARVLEFYHPVTGKIMRFETPVPNEFMKILNASKRTSDNG